MCQLIDAEDITPVYATRNNVEFWTARLISNAPISNALLAPGLVAVALGLLGGMEWANSGFWLPVGAYSRFVSPIIGLGWVVVVSWVLLNRSSTAHAR